MLTPLNKTDSLKDSVYPEVDMQNFGPMIAFKTILRRMHDGIWYKYDHQSSYLSSGPTEDNKLEMLAKFHTDVYIEMTLGILNTDLVNSDGDPIFRVDDNQDPEQERLINKMKENG